jgi:hypothetical protein
MTVTHTHTTSICSPLELQGGEDERKWQLHVAGVPNG